jgi:hypothetical protein
MIITLVVAAVSAVPTVLAVQYILEAAAAGCKLTTPAANAFKTRCFHI